MQCLKTKRPIEQVALQLLARREHSRLQLTQKLLQRGFEIAEINAALSDLTTRNLLSHSRFADSYVYTRVAKGFGPVRIAVELRERGIDDTLIQQTLAEYQGEWSQLAKTVYEKRFGLTKPDHYVEKAKRQQFMLYRGFTHEHIKEVCEADE